MNFVISTTPGAPIKYGEGKSIQQNRFHNGVTPIMGPIEDSELKEFLEFLKTQDPNVTHIVFTGYVLNPLSSETSA